MAPQDPLSLTAQGLKCNLVEGYCAKKPCKGIQNKRRRISKISNLPGDLIMGFSVKMRPLMGIFRLIHTALFGLKCKHILKLDIIFCLNK